MYRNVGHGERLMYGAQEVGKKVLKVAVVVGTFYLLARTGLKGLTSSTKFEPQDGDKSGDEFESDFRPDLFRESLKSLQGLECVMINSPAFPDHYDPGFPTIKNTYQALIALQEAGANINGPVWLITNDGAKNMVINNTDPSFRRSEGVNLERVYNKNMFCAEPATTSSLPESFRSREKKPVAGVKGRIRRSQEIIAQIRTQHA